MNKNEQYFQTHKCFFNLHVDKTQKARFLYYTSNNILAEKGTFCTQIISLYVT